MGDEHRRALDPPDDSRSDARRPARGRTAPPAAFGRYLAEHIPGAKYVELPGADTFPFGTGDFAPLLDEVEEFLTGVRSRPVLNRQLATVLFTDIVGSTRLAAERGDAAWSTLVREHDELVREHLERTAGVRSTAPATASSPPSTDPRGRSPARSACRRR